MSNICSDPAENIDAKGRFQAQCRALPNCRRGGDKFNVSQSDSELEVHLSTAPGPCILSELAIVAARFDCKLLQIELDQGAHPIQPMLSFRVRGDVDAALARAHEVAAGMRESGLDPIRTKIEADLTSISVETACYAEAHYKIRALTSAWPKLIDLAARHGAHLSRNAWSRQSQTEWRFLTLRERNLSRARGRFAAFAEKLHESGWHVERTHQEAVLYDDNLNLDHGWLT